VIFIQMKISSLNVNPLKFNSKESHNILENSLFFRNLNTIQLSNPSSAVSSTPNPQINN